MMCLGFFIRRLGMSKVTCNSHIWSSIPVWFGSFRSRCPLSLITRANVNKLSGYKPYMSHDVMGFYNETIIGLQNDSNKGPV